MFVAAIAIPPVFALLCAGLYGWLGRQPRFRQRPSFGVSVIFAACSIAASIPVGYAHQYADIALHPGDDWAGAFVMPGTVCVSFFLSPFVGFLSSLLLITIRNRRRFPPGHCQKCGYNLTGNVSGRCPECGSPVHQTGGTA